jgi:hypothetical protein
MSIQWMDNFNMYGGSLSTAQDGTPWIAFTGLGGALVEDPDPNATGFVLEIPGPTGSARGNARLALTTPGTVAGMAFRLWQPALPSSPSKSPIFAVHSAGNSVIYAVRLYPNGSLRIERGTTEIADSVAPVVFAGAWNHLEFRFDTVTGEISAWREGIPITALTITDPAPPGTTVGIVGFDSAYPGDIATSYPLMKDLVVYDGSGTENNTQIGPVTVYNLLVDADVSSGWVPSSGSSDAALLGVEDPDDLNYIAANATPPAPSIMTFQDLPEDVVSVRAIMPLIRMMKTDGGDAQVQMTVGGDAGADRTMTTAFAYYWDISEVDPATTDPWTPIAVNAAEIEVARTV